MISIASLSQLCAYQNWYFKRSVTSECNTLTELKHTAPKLRCSLALPSFSLKKVMGGYFLTKEVSGLILSSNLFSHKKKPQASASLSQPVSETDGLVSGKV